MPRKREDAWFKVVCDRMVRESLPIRQAAGEEGVGLGVEEAAKIFRSRTFQTVLWQSRWEYYNEIASNPARTKAAVLGMMTLAIQGLASEAQWKEVLEGALKLAKVEGWVGGDQNVNVFGNVTAKDIETEKARLLELLGQVSTADAGQSQPN